MVTAWYNSRVSLKTCMNNLQPAYIYGFTTRKDGDMRYSSYRKKVLKSRALTDRFEAVMRQVHGSSVAMVGNTNAPQYFPKSDALVYKIKKSDKFPSPVLIVRTADCVPILLRDAEKGIYGVVHAGWKGTLHNIAQKTVRRMISNGSDIRSIQATIGPHIKSCCYSVDEKRARIFLKTFPSVPKGTVEKKSTWYLNLEEINRNQLQSLGVSDIECSSTCTYCTPEKYFSFRQQNKKYGEMMGYITIV